MAIPQILAHPSIRAAVPLTRKADRLFVEDWVRRRVRRLIWAKEATTDAESGTTTPELITRLARELAQVEQAHLEIKRRIWADPHHYSFATQEDRKAIRHQVSSGNPALGRDPRLFRDDCVRSIVYQAAADDMLWVERNRDPMLTRLHRLTDRRLRTVEVMAHQIGSRPDGISAAAWPSPRMFEFAPWDATAGHARIRANAAARDCWPSNPGNFYELDFTPSAGHVRHAAEAIRALFTPFDQEEDRNQFACDHVMMALHLEALDFAERGRGAGPDWLDSERESQPVLWQDPEWENRPDAVRARWLRISNQFDNDGVFLGGRRERVTGSNTHFIHKSVCRGYKGVCSDRLQVGDHLIVFNHPLFQYIAPFSPWALENCVVMQTIPDVLVQGIGYGAALTIDAMRDDLLNKLDACVKQAATDWSELKTAGTGTVNVSPGVGSRVFPAYEYKEWPKRTTAGRQTINHLWLLRKYDPGIFLQYRGERELAAWYLVWECSGPECRNIYNNPVLSNLVRDLQKVELTTNDGELMYGWFPLATLDPASNDFAEEVLSSDSAFGWWDISAENVRQSLDAVTVIRPAE